MSMWPPEKVPILTTLAKEFALFDRWFASYPGSTHPNRSFLLSGTAHGCEDTGCIIDFSQKTLFGLLNDFNKSWKIYNEDSLWMFSIELKELRTIDNLLKYKDMSKFYEDAANGTLPDFSFIEPRLSPNKNKGHEPSMG